MAPLGVAVSAATPPGPWELLTQPPEEEPVQAQEQWALLIIQCVTVRGVGHMSK